MWSMKRFGLAASEEKSFENVDDDEDDARMPARLLYYKLTLWAFGSGELIIQGILELN